MNVKALLLVILSIVLVLSNQVSADTRTGRASISRTQLRNFLERYVALSNARDFEGLKALYVSQPREARFQIVQVMALNKPKASVNTHPISSAALFHCVYLVLS